MKIYSYIYILGDGQREASTMQQVTRKKGWGHQRILMRAKLRTELQKHMRSCVLYLERASRLNFF